MTKKEESKEVLLTEDEVWDVIKYAREINSGYLAGMPLSPDLINQAMQRIGLGQTGEVTEQQVTDAMADPRSSEEELRRISQSFDVTNPIYKRLLSYISNLPSFDYTFTCTNATMDDYKGSAKTKYQQEYQKVKEFLTRFDAKQEFSKIMHQLMRNEAYFSIFRDDGDKYVFQELPQDRVKISAKFDHGLMFSFDYNYFKQPGVNINFYPPVFKREYVKLHEDKIDPKGYDPAELVSNRAGHGFALWVDCSPKDNFWMFKLSPEIITRIPYFSTLFPDLVNQGVIRELQKSSYMASASKIITGVVPMLQGKATVKDAISISPELLGKFMALVKSAINSEAVRIAASPLTDMESHEFTADSTITPTYLKTTLAESGVSTNLLFSQDTKNTVLEAALSVNIDEILATSVYPQFNDFVNWQLAKLTDKYKFEVRFEGSNIYTDRDRRLEKAMTLAQTGIVLPQKISAAMGMSPFEFENQLEMARASGFVDNLTPILMSGQMSKNESGGDGTNAKKESELSEEGIQTRSDGGNMEKTLT